MQFGNYILLKKLGTGGMAEVFLAKQKGLAGFERLVCIKRILPHLTENTEFITMFQDEARIAANLNHPNIVQIYDLDQADGCYFIAMELIKGEDIRQIYNAEVARGHTIPFVNAAQIIYGAANGLGFAHASCDANGKPLGLVHRDISPQNILVTYNGYPKIVDFGVAKARGKMTETRSGVLKGKYSYMSPEQAKGKTIDGRSDVFALGIVLYEITTGQRLFKRENEIETLHAVMNCRVTPPSKINPAYPPDLEAIVLKALAANVDQRYATAYDMANDLERFIINHGSSTSPQALATYMQDLFTDKLKDDPYSQEKLEEMAKQASTVSLAGVSTSNRTPKPVSSEPTVTGTNRRMGGRNTVSRVVNVDGQDVIYDEVEYTKIWYFIPVLILVTIIAVYFAMAKWRSPSEEQKAIDDAIAQLNATNQALLEYQQMPPQVIQVIQEPAPAPTPPPVEIEQPAPAPTPAPAPVAKQPRKANATGTLLVNGSSKWQLYADGKDLGSVAKHSFNLAPGNYNLRFVHNGSGATHTEKAAIKSGSEVTISLPTGSGALFVNARPYGKVWLGTNSVRDDTPKAYKDLPAGDYVVNCQCENGRTHKEVHKITTGGTTRVVFDCAKK